MFYHASIVKEIKLATFLIDTFVIAPLNSMMSYAMRKVKMSLILPLSIAKTYSISLSEKSDFLVHVFCQELHRKRLDNSHWKTIESTALAGVVLQLTQVAMLEMS